MLPFNTFTFSCMLASVVLWFHPFQSLSYFTYRRVTTNITTLYLLASCRPWTAEESKVHNLKHVRFNFLLGPLRSAINIEKGNSSALANSTFQTRGSKGWSWQPGPCQSPSLRGCQSLGCIQAEPAKTAVVLGLNKGHISVCKTAQTFLILFKKPIRHGSLAASPFCSGASALGFYNWELTKKP